MMYRISRIFRVRKYWRMASSTFKIFADAASCEKGDWGQQLPSRIKISRMICEPQKKFSYSKYLRYTVNIKSVSTAEEGEMLKSKSDTFMEVCYAYIPLRYDRHTHWWVLEAGGHRGMYVPPQIFWRGGTGGHHAVRKCTMKFAVLSK